MTMTEVVLQGLDYSIAAPLEKKDTDTTKGWGVFAKEKIEKDNFLCEYRTTRLYHPRDKAKYVKE